MKRNLDTKGYQNSHRECKIVAEKNDDPPGCGVLVRELTKSMYVWNVAVDRCTKNSQWHHYKLPPPSYLASHLE